MTISADINGAGLAFTLVASPSPRPRIEAAIRQAPLGQTRTKRITGIRSTTSRAREWSRRRPSAAPMPTCSSRHRTSTTWRTRPPTASSRAGASRCSVCAETQFCRAWCAIAREEADMTAPFTWYLGMLPPTQMPADEFVVGDLRLRLMGNSLEVSFEGTSTGSADAARALAERYVEALRRRLVTPLWLQTEEEFLARTNPPFGGMVQMISAHEKTASAPIGRSMKHVTNC